MRPVNYHFTNSTDILSIRRCRTWVPRTGWMEGGHAAEYTSRPPVEPSQVADALRRVSRRSWPLAPASRGLDEPGLRLCGISPRATVCGRFSPPARPISKRASPRDLTRWPAITGVAFDPRHEPSRRGRTVGMHPRLANTSHPGMPPRGLATGACRAFDEPGELNEAVVCAAAPWSLLGEGSYG